MKQLLLVFVLILAGSLIHAGAKQAKLSIDQRVSQLEEIVQKQAAYNYFLEQRTQYLKDHIDALEQGEKVIRASR